MKHTFTLFSAFLCLLVSPLSAQDAEQLTDFHIDRWRVNPVEQLASLSGQIYTANQLTYSGTARFGRIDPESGNHVALADPDAYFGGSYGDRLLGAFQVVDGKLFGRKQSGDATDLYRIDGDRAIRLTQLASYPLTRLVEFRDQYYFLVAGRSAAYSPDDRLPAVYTEIWRTDGTPEGTAFVAELPVVNPDHLSGQPPMLVAGAEGLLVSGNTVAERNSTYRSYFIFRPESGTTQVSLPEEPDGTVAALRYFDNVFKEVIFFAGGFYTTGIIKSADYTTPELYRIDEADATMRPIPGLLQGASQSFREDRASFAVAGDSLYLHLVDPYEGYVLYAAGNDSPEKFRTVAQSGEYAADAAIISRGDTLYFGGAAGDHPFAILEYVPGKGSPRVLFTDAAGGLRGNLYAGADVVYIVDDLDHRVLRYLPSASSLAMFYNFDGGISGKRRYSAHLYGNDLIYNGYTMAGNYALAETEPYILTPTADAPRVLSPTAPAEPGGVYHALSELADGRLLLHAGSESSESPYHLYDPATGEAYEVRPPADIGLSYTQPVYIKNIEGKAFFSAYSYDHYQYRIFVLLGDSLAPVVEATTLDPLVTDDRYFLTSGPLEIDRQQEYLSLYRYSFTDSTYTRERILHRERQYTTAYAVGDYIRLVEVREDAQYISLLRADGTPLYDFTIPVEAKLVQADSAGSYHLLHPVGATPTLEYRSADQSRKQVFAYPEGVAPDTRRLGFLLADRLVFFPFDRAGGREPYVADPATGRIERLADIQPGPGGSNPHRRWKIGDRLFFAADDGVHGTELWRTDGTVAGTRLLADINPGAASGAPGSFYTGDSLLYFQANGASGWEVYGLHLEQEKVGIVADIHPGAGSSYAQDFLETSDGLYAVATPGEGEAQQLFRLAQRLISTVREPRAAGAHLRLFPNPAATAVTLLAEPGEQLERVRLFDAAGRFLRELQTAAERISLPVHDLVPGRYWAVVHYASGARRSAALVVTR